MRGNPMDNIDLNTIKAPGAYRFTAQKPPPATEGTVKGVSYTTMTESGTMAHTVMEDGRQFATWTPDEGVRVRIHHTPEHGWFVDGEDWDCPLCKVAQEA